MFHHDSACRAAYGTYVVFFTSVECIVSETEQWNPQREIMVLVLMTWVFQALTLYVPHQCPLPLWLALQVIDYHGTVNSHTVSKMKRLTKECDLHVHHSPQLRPKRLEHHDRRTTSSAFLHAWQSPGRHQRFFCI